MNSSKLLKAGMIAAMVAAPYQTYAVSTEAGLEACTNAMVEQLAEDQGGPMVYNLDPESDGSARRMDRREIFHLDAKDPDSQEVVARYDCFINGNAQVQKLVRVPLDAPDAQFRATGLN